MPTIEIVCVEQATLIDFSSLPFAVRAEKELESHRGLFQRDFDKLKGCIYHLGNPDMRGDNDLGFWAYELIDEAIQDDEEDILKFNEKYVVYVKDMLNQLLIASPKNQVIFSSDWQFGSEIVQRFEGISIEQFWEMHDKGELRSNSLYEVNKYSS